MSWTKSGDFNISLGGKRYDRVCTYRNSEAESDVRSFSLRGHYNGVCNFEMQISPQLLESLRNVPELFYLRSTKIECSFERGDTEGFHRLLDTISQHSPQFAAICDDFKQHIDPIITAAINPPAPRGR